jgi:hypothetical protein
MDVVQLLFSENKISELHKTMEQQNNKRLSNSITNIYLPKATTTEITNVDSYFSIPTVTP